MAKLRLNGDRLIRLPVVDTKANYLAGFWQWIALLAADDYAGAQEALHWSKARTSWTPEALRERITTLWGGAEPWSVVVPNERLVGVINDTAEFEPRNAEGFGWFLAHVPVTNEPATRRTTTFLSWASPARFVCSDLASITSWNTRSSTPEPRGTWPNAARQQTAVTLPGIRRALQCLLVPRAEPDYTYCCPQYLHPRKG